MWAAFTASLIATAKARDVTLAAEVQAPIIADGKQIGSVKLPAGSTVALVSIESDGVMVSRGGGTPFKVSKEDIAPEALMTPSASPSPTQTPVPTPVPQAPISSSSPSPPQGALIQPLSDEVETKITCELTQAPRYSDVPVFKTEKEAQKTLGTYHYKLWLPKGYNADLSKRWPCMFVMSPSGNASMRPMTDYLKNNGFVVVMLVEAKNGPWEPIVGNFLAAHDDVIKRVRIDESQKYATGQSGGARGSSVFVQLRSGFCGLILQSAGASFDDKNNYNVAGIKSNARLRIAMTMGASDKNKPETERMKKLFDGRKLAVFEFNGGHVWAPADVFEKAMAWVNGTTPGTSASGVGPSSR